MIVADAELMIRITNARISRVRRGIRRSAAREDLRWA
jgi:hypothetical protein